MILPVRDDLPAFDFLRQFRPAAVDLSYHLEVHWKMFREALEVTRFLDKNKIGGSVGYLSELRRAKRLKSK